MRTREIRPKRAGDKVAIVAVESSNGRCKVSEFLEDLFTKSPNEYATLYSRLDMLRERGTVLNPKIITHINDHSPIQEIRHPRHTYRITCFYDGGSIVLIEAWHKKSNKDKKAAGMYARALQLHKELKQERKRKRK